MFYIKQKQNMDNEYSSFYLYRKYEVIGDELVDLGITSIDANGTLDPVVKEECDQTCGCLNYTELCAIEKKTGYIGNVDLGLRLTNNFKIQISFNYKTANGSLLIGEGGDTRFFKAADGNTYLDLGGQRIYWGNASFCPLNTDVTFEIGNRYVKNLGNNLQMTGSTITFTSQSNLLLFSSENKDLAVVYWVKVYDGDTLVGDFIPVIKPFDSVVTMYNKVTDTFCNVNGTLYGIT